MREGHSKRLQIGGCKGGRENVSKSGAGENVRPETAPSPCGWSARTLPLWRVSGRPFLTFGEIYQILYSIIQETAKHGRFSSICVTYVCGERPGRGSVSVRSLQEATVCTSTQQSVSMLSIRQASGRVPGNSTKP